MNHRRLNEISPEFRHEIPTVNELEFGKLYLSLHYKAAIHLCACGCGAKISTPLHPTGWRVSYDGKTVSLYPSVGNWAEECESHYIIRNSRVIWAEKFTRDRIKNVREKRAQDLQEYYDAERLLERTPDQPIPFWKKVLGIFRL